MRRQSNPPSALSLDATGDVTSEVLSLEHPQVVRRVQQYRAALEDGQSPDRQQLLHLFPSIASQLSACLDALDFVHEVAPRLREAHQGDLWPDTQPDDAPATLGDFRIVREIGRGGMGVVYEAEQVSLGRRVALKVLPLAAVLDQRQLQRFRTEAQAAASLHHQNIVPVHGVGRERGVHYYAMQYIQGQSLFEVIRDLRRLEKPETGRGGNDAATEHSLAESLATGRFDPQGTDENSEAVAVGYPSPSSPVASQYDQVDVAHDPVDPLNAAVNRMPRQLTAAERELFEVSDFENWIKIGEDLQQSHTDDQRLGAQQEDLIHRIRNSTQSI